MAREKIRLRALLHPFHALLLAFPVAFFPAALLSDIAYLNSAEIQWTNFAAWLIVGGLVFGAVALIWALIAAFFLPTGAERRAGLIHAALLGGMWTAGLLNAFQHSKDGWSSVGMFGLILSLISAALALAAGWTAHAVRAPIQPVGSYRETVA